MFGKLAATVTLFMVPLPATAQDAVQVEGWWIAPVAPSVCQIGGTFKGDTMITFIDGGNQRGMVSLGDNSWQLDASKTYNATISWDNWKTSRSLTMRANKGSSGMWIVAGMTGGDLSQQIRQAKRLAVRLPALRIDGAVAMPDAAMARLSSCRGS